MIKIHLSFREVQLGPSLLGGYENKVLTKDKVFSTRSFRQKLGIMT